MRRIQLILLYVFLVNFGCSNTDPELDNALTYFSTKLDNIQIDELKEITTETGFVSLMKHSDFLDDKQFFERLSENLMKGGEGVFNTYVSDSIVVLSLGKSDDIIGATEGYLILNRTKEGYMINQFRPGK